MESANRLKQFIEVSGFKQEVIMIRQDAPSMDVMTVFIKELQQVSFASKQSLRRKTDVVMMLIARCGKMIHTIPKVQVLGPMPGAIVCLTIRKCLLAFYLRHSRSCGMTNFGSTIPGE